jgi:predicted permease
MNIDFFNVFATVLSLIVLVVPGFLLTKYKFIGEKAAEAFSTFVLYGSQTVMVFMGFQGKAFSPEIGINMLVVAGVATVVMFGIYAIACLMIRNKSDDVKRRTMRYGCVFSNCGYMGLPLINSLFNGQECLSEAIIYTAVVLAVFNVINWTLGAYICTNDKKSISIKKVLLNPVIISVVLGFLVYGIVQVPLVDLAPQGGKVDIFVEKVMSSLDIIGNTVTPLSMTVIGIKLAGVNTKQLFLDKDAYYVTAIKLIGMSIFAMLVVKFLPVNDVVKYTMFFLFSTPCATSTALFALRFGGDANYGSVTVLLSTVLSIITIPLMFLLFQAII